MMPTGRKPTLVADAPTVHRRVDVNVHAGVPVVRLLLGLPLDPADDPAFELDHVGGHARLVEVLLDGRDQVAPPRQYS
jgi:hypothetical protein